MRVLPAAVKKQAVDTVTGLAYDCSDGPSAIAADAVHAGTGWVGPDHAYDASETDLGKLLPAESVSAPVTVPLSGAGIVTGTEGEAGIAAGTEVASEPGSVTETVACHVLASVKTSAQGPALAKRLLPVTVSASEA